MPDKPIGKPATHPKPTSTHLALSLVPTGPAFAALEDDHFRWEVTVTSLGGLKKGDKVGVIHMQPGTDIDRLVRLGYLIPLTADESIDAIFADKQPEVPPYAVADLQPPKPVLPATRAHTFEEAAKADDLRIAAEAKVAEDARLKADDEARAKREADEKVKAEAVAKAKIEAEKSHAEAARVAQEKAKAEADAKAKSEADAKAKAEKAAADAKSAADAKAKADAARQESELAKAKTDAEKAVKPDLK